MKEHSLKSVDAMHIAEQTMLASQERLRVISENIANTSTPGAKRSLSAATPFAVLLSRANVQTSIPGSNTAQIDTSAGALRHTGRAMDLAIDGTGYFEISGSNGPLYTRRGDFRLDGEMRLCTQDGLPIAGQRGDITLAGHLPVEINRDGEILQGGKSVGKLRIVALPKDGHLEPVGVSTFALQGDKGATPVEHASVKVGHLEAANVNVADEMVHLMQTIRQYEAMSRVVQMMDESTEKVIRKIGDM